jgi:hypothetical protein
MTKLYPVTDIPHYAVIVRAMWERGQNQLDAVHELTRRGLWLTQEQADQGDLDKLDEAPWYRQRNKEQCT